MNARAVGVVVLLCLAGGGAWWRYGADAPATPKKAAPPPVPVALAQAERRDLPIRLDVVGRAEAYDSVTLRSRVDGQVAKVVYTEGQMVKPGDVLLRLDPADFEARLRQAEGVLARDQAQLAKARQDVERYVSLKARGFVSDEKVGEVRTAATAQEASVKADEAAVDLARLQLSYTTVRATIAGQLGARLVSPGTAVKTNDTPLAVVNRVQPLYVSFPVPEKYLPRVQAALRGGALDVAVAVPGGGQKYVGKARFLDNAVDAASGTIQMKAVLPNDAQALTPGQFVNVGLALDVLRDAVTVPAEALQQGQEGPFVFAVGSDGAVQPRRIKVAAIQGGTVAVAEGLAPGDTVVTDGHLRLAPGTRIKAKEDAKAAPAAPTAAH